MASTPGEPDATVVTLAPAPPGYEILEVIGSGGAGTVYRARQLHLDREVAVKVIRPDRLEVSNLAARFETEAVILGQLRHPNIVQVHDLVRHTDRMFLVLELLTGEDLGRRVQRLGPCGERFAWIVARQAAAALAHAAAHGVIHRDVKPSNLFLVGDPTGGEPTVKVMDFGLAKWSVPLSDLHTLPGTLMGTPAYMAPEQARGDRCLDHRADIYSLGATVYHILAGEPPFGGKTVWDMMTQKLHDSPRLGPPVSRGSAELVAAMMAPDLGRRVGTYVELIARIDAVMAGRPTPAARPGRSYRWLRAASVTLLVGATGAGVWAGVGRERTAVTPEGGTAPIPSGDYLALFDGATLNGWRPQSGLWRVDADEEGVKVLAGSGTMRRWFEPVGDCRLTVALDVHKATAAEIHLCMAAGPGTAVRVSRDTGATLVARRADPAREQTVPFPPAAWFEDRRPYLEVKAERVGGRWTTWFNGRLVGHVDESGPAATELRVVAEGGAIRIDSVVVTPIRGG